MKVVPDRDEGNAEEKAESSPKVCHLLKENHDIEFKKMLFLPSMFQVLFWSLNIHKHVRVELKQTKLNLTQNNISCWGIIPTKDSIG